MSNEFNLDCLHGRILFIDDLITYEGENVSGREASFKEAVDEYVTHCEKTGKPANKPYSGSFNVRVGTDLHRSVAQCAKRKDVSLNELVRSALEKKVKQFGDVEVVRHDLTVNHVITHDQQSVGMPYSLKEQSLWQPHPEKSRSKLSY